MSEQTSLLSVFLVNVMHLVYTIFNLNPLSQVLTCPSLVYPWCPPHRCQPPLPSKTKSPFPQPVSPSVFLVSPHDLPLLIRLASSLPPSASQWTRSVNLTFVILQQSSRPAALPRPGLTTYFPD